MESMVGVTLKKIRKDKNIPIQTICEGVMDPATYWRLENGKINSSFPTVLQILERMNILSKNLLKSFFHQKKVSINLTKESSALILKIKILRS